jgi:hypothetical protein
VVGNTKMCCCFSNDDCNKNLEEIFVTFEESTGNRNMFLCFGELIRGESAVL